MASYLSLVNRSTDGSHPEMTYLRLISTHDLKPNEMVGKEIGDKAILIANVGGIFYVIGNTCTHMNCLLSEGRLNGLNVTCPCHVSIFNVQTGAVVKGPAKIPEPVYLAKVEADEVYVDL
jgi:nitrite reductase/ring-hydroxylating ferredoxin subunit